jgi:ATP/maltotriose-dependent transcriptional regulator MalT
MSYNLEIQAKTQAFHDLKTLVKQAQENPFLIQEQLQTLLQKTKEQIRNENSWSNFQRMFQKLDRKFMDELTKQFPNLSENEIRLCCLMRMNVESNEIVKMLNISKNTLKSARFRIHKKMNLPAGIRLADFLLKM